MLHFGFRNDQIAMIGDRVLTDVLYANRVGVYSIFCRQIVSSKGDNRVAGLVRSIEHFFLDIYLK